MQLQGNDAFRRGVQLRKRFFLREAVDLYTKGINLHPQDSALLALLRSNRAQAHLRLANNRNALDDASAALQLDPHLSKVRRLSRSYLTAAVAGRLSNSAACFFGVGILPCCHSCKALGTV